MTATINGEPREFADGTTLADVLAALGIETAGIAVAVNDSVVRKAALGSHGLRDGDAVEIIRAVAGG